MRRPSFASLLAALPSQCAVCRTWQRQPLCHDCLQRFARTAVRCRTCGLRLEGGAVQCGACLREAPPLDFCLCAVDYGYPWSGCIARLKFRGEPGTASALAALLRDTPGAGDALAQAHCVLPMPLAPGRLRERGFNQALELARRLAPGKADGQLLLRIRETPPQVARSAAERSRNVRGAFAVEPLRTHGVEGKNMLLVDDVMTSGASLFAAARALRSAGAQRVGALVLARTPLPDTPPAA